MLYEMDLIAFADPNLVFASGLGQEIWASPRPATCGAPEGERGGGQLERPHPRHRNGAPLFVGPQVGYYEKTGTQTAYVKR